MANNEQQQTMIKDYDYLNKQHFTIGRL